MLLQGAEILSDQIEQTIWEHNFFYTMNPNKQNFLCENDNHQPGKHIYMWTNQTQTKPTTYMVSNAIIRSSPCTLYLWQDELQCTLILFPQMSVIILSRYNSAYYKHVLVYNLSHIHKVCAGLNVYRHCPR